MYSHGVRSCFFFFNDTATTEIYTLSLHDALPILRAELAAPGQQFVDPNTFNGLFSVHASLMIFLFIIPVFAGIADRKSTRLNSSHANISYAVFCLKKKKTITYQNNNHNVDQHKTK